MTNRFGSGWFSHDCLQCCIAASAIAIRVEAVTRQGFEASRSEIILTFPTMEPATPPTSCLQTLSALSCLPEVWKNCCTSRQSGATMLMRHVASQQGHKMESGVIIKKYGNRRLYDTRDSRYINLDEIARYI